MQYYIRLPDETHINGPFSLDELQSSLETGDLTPGHLVLPDDGQTPARLGKHDGSAWIPVPRVPGLVPQVSDALPNRKECEWCGQKNAEDAIQCSDCFASLIPKPEPSPARKSKTVAVILTLIFGPLGLLYLGMEGFIAIVVVIGTAFFLAPLIFSIKGGVWLVVLVRVGCAIWAVRMVESREAETPDVGNAEMLLEQAARLESTDVPQAIATYKKIMDSFPNTAASAEAKRNIQTLENRPDNRKGFSA